ncbi:MAG: serine hydrolase [Desulfobacterales bacterium]|nr:serine hydrolase [Desulfobacterales bacterium]
MPTSIRSAKIPGIFCNWTRYILDLPLAEPPGTRFVYCNGASHLLSAIVQKATGMRSLAYARQNLFSPLGITDVIWETDPQGIDVGFGRMWLRPHDMAKFGWLFLNKGQWEGRTIVAADWVNAATRGHIQTKSSDRYGYQWWVDKEGSFAAMGHRGQRIFVVPEHDLVAVFTCFHAPRTPDFVMRSHIIPSIVSDVALPPDTAANQRLKALVRQYMLDDVYRLSNAPVELTAFKGRWRTDFSFSSSFFEIGHTLVSKAEIEFNDEQARVRVTDPQGGMIELKATSDPDPKREVEN